MTCCCHVLQRELIPIAVLESEDASREVENKLALSVFASPILYVILVYIICNYTT